MSKLVIVYGLIILACIISLFLIGVNIRHFCGGIPSLHRNTEKYIDPFGYTVRNNSNIPNIEEIEANRSRRGWLPPSIDLQETGGILEQEAGIEPSRPLTPNPWDKPVNIIL